ncbi:MAG TPA: hypothetical protein DDW76_04210, partial [Cyanobacteria bacterium UBA11369]|nr:hypothetical protein [Cyanobacteria bacterium UBA11367]HBE48013.1 hypothetical protein [Cyanobacteria bacterium UBA11369]
NLLARLGNHPRGARNLLAQLGNHPKGDRNLLAVTDVQQGDRKPLFVKSDRDLLILVEEDSRNRQLDAIPLDHRRQLGIEAILGI